MLKRLIPQSVMSLVLSATCLLPLAAYGNPPVYNYPSHSQYEQTPPPSTRYYTGREEVAYSYPQGSYYYNDDAYGRDTYVSNRDPYKLRSWDWDYKENWREDKDVFYSGGQQTNALQRDFRYQRPPGIGDPDDAYWLDPQFYRRPAYDYQRGYNVNYSNDYRNYDSGYRDPNYYRNYPSGYRNQDRYYYNSSSRY